MPRIHDTELHRLRNRIAIADVLRHLDIPAKTREGFLRFLCPLCHEFNTATNPRTNLARCFRCQKNFNPIDLVIAVEETSFLDAVRYLQHHFPQPQSAITNPPFS